MDTAVVHGTNSTNLFALVPSDLPPVWPQIAYIMREHGRGLIEYCDPEDIYQLAMDHKVLLWAGIDDGVVELVVILSIISTPKIKRGKIDWVGGSQLRKYLKLGGLERIEKLLMMEGAKMIQITGRPAWKRLLAGHGYVASEVLLNKDISILWSK